MEVLDRIADFFTDFINKKTGITYNILKKESTDFVAAIGRGIHGGTMTAAQRANIDTAINRMNTGYSEYLIVTGGWTENKALPGELTEAGEMQKLAVEQGIDPEKIIVDCDSKDTEASLEFIERTMMEKDFTSGIIVADFSHFARVKWLVHRKGIVNVKVVASAWDNKRYDLGMPFWQLMFREWAAYIIAKYAPRGLIKRIRGI